MSPMKRLTAALFFIALPLVPLPSRARQEGSLSSQTLAQSVPLFTFRPQGRNPALILLRQGEAKDGVPRVYYSSREGWLVAEFSEGLRKASWVAAGRAANGLDVWAVAQEEDSGYLVFVNSNNGGRSWRQRGPLRKISKRANLVFFGMNRDNKGSAILELADDPAPDAPRLGHYLYLTDNGGKTWSSPIFSQSRPSGPINELQSPDETFRQDGTPDTALWQRLLSSLAPAE
jgi:hypothetical protein